MRRTIAATSGAALVLAVVTGTPVAAQNTGHPSAYRPPAEQMICESWQFKRRQCPADTRGGVRLLQVTGGLCTQGQTWGFDHRGVWVDNGCRAIFAVRGGGGYRPPPANRLIVCESWQFRPHRCAADVHRTPRIEVIAGRCVAGQTWGWDRRSIWVDGGCRARFLVG